MAVIEVDDVLQCLDGRIGPEPGEIQGHVCFQFILQHRRFCRVGLVDDGQLLRVDERGARLFHRVKCHVHDRFDSVVEVEVVAGNADLGAESPSASSDCV